MPNAIMPDTVMPDTVMKDRVAVITGASSGLGRETATALAGFGARLVLVCRDRARADAAVERIGRTTGGADVRVVLGDLSRQGDVRRVAEEILSVDEPLHVLCNNAGAVFGFTRELSADGIEMTIALNHLAYYTLSLLLLPRLRASAPARIVNVASDAYKDAKGRFDFDDYGAERSYKPIRQYGRSKLANILFTRELARRLAGSGVTVNAATPPRLTATRFAHNVHPLAGVALRIARPFTMSIRKGARPIVHLCSSPDVEGTTGSYWSGMTQPELTAAATNDEDARQLWELSASLAGVDLE